MAGITDSAFRQICRENGADVVYSEMASATALFFNPNHTLELVKFNKTDRPYVVQLFGKVPEHFAVAAKIITEKVKPDGIDINFGCPAKKVFGHGSGCALMPQKKLAREIIQSVCGNTNLPVSIKIRAGINSRTATYQGTLHDTLPKQSSIDALEFIENTRDLPYSAIMIHGRTYEGNFSGKVDFGICEEIKKLAPEKIVLANGGIMTPEDGAKTLNDYSLLDGLGIARGAWGQPFIFQQIKDLVKNGKYEEYDFPKIKKIMIRHAKLIHKDKGKRGLFEIRKHMSWYVKGFPGAAQLRRKLVLAGSAEEIKEILKTAI